MNRILVIFVLSLYLVTPCHAQPEMFTSDQPSPLKLIKPANPKVFTWKFRGSVQLSGRFSVLWLTPDYLQVVFFPDQPSAALLPYERGRRRVEVLHLSNNERAARLLLEAATAHKICAKELPGAEGAATVTIRDYESSVSCDTRGYSADLVSASRMGEIVLAAQAGRHFGC